MKFFSNIELDEGFYHDIMSHVAWYKKKFLIFNFSLNTKEMVCKYFCHLYQQSFIYVYIYIRLGELKGTQLFLKIL